MEPANVIAGKSAAEPPAPSSASSRPVKAT
jgi:hypothetical protein